MKNFLVLVALFFLAPFMVQGQVIDEIAIEGLKKTKKSFVENFVILRKGAKLDSIVIQKDVDALARLSSIANATYKVIPKDEGNYKVVYILQENLTLIPTANIWTSSNKDLAYRFGIYEFNTLGRNITVGGFYQKDIFDSFGANLRMPYAFGRNWGFELNFQNLSSEEPVFFEDGTTAQYKYQNTSYEVVGIHRFNFQNTLGLGVNYFKENYSYLRGATQDGVPLILEAHKISYKLLYTFNTITYDFYQLSGFKSVLNLQYVRGADGALPSFLVGWNDFLYFNRVTPKGNWANRLRIGVATNDETPFAPFAVDNNVNIRGVGNIIDRGTASIVYNTEYRQALLEKGWFALQGNAFIDAGTWRNPGGDFSDLVDSTNIRVFSGLGLRFIHKRIFNATFRIDYGYGLTKNDSRGIVFGIGQYF